MKGQTVGYVSLVLLFVAFIKVSDGASWFETRADSCSSFNEDASDCIAAFKPFATRKPSLTEICAAYDSSKPCMDGELERCGSDPGAQNTDVYKQWKMLEGTNPNSYCSNA